MIAAVIGAIAIGAGAEASAPEMNIAYCNLSFSDNIYIKYAVKSDVADVKLLIWTSPESEYVIGTQDDEITEYYTENIGGVPHMIFDYTKLAAKQMADVVYARAYTQVDGVDYYSSVNKYSILQYAYSKLGKTGTASTNAELKDMLLKYSDKKIYVVGDGYAVTHKALCGSELHLSETPALLRAQNAASVGIVAERMLSEGNYTTDSLLSPVYLRMPQAERERLERENKQ